MDKKTNELVSKLKSVFNNNEIEQLARETGFTKRKGKMTGEKFMALCIFHGESLCTDSLVDIHSRLKANEDLVISPQGVDKHFEKDESVTFIKKIFKKVLALQNQVLSHNENWLHTRFSSINVTDSTTIQLPKEYLEKYMGCGGGGSKSSVKIQLEYNCYITNVPRELLEKGQIHDMYSLRWQIELMFKIWKSIFKIDKIKKVKINRFECFLYGRLISLLLTASIVFTIKRDLANAGHELSEMKSFSIVDKSFKRLRTDLFKSKKRLLALFYSFKSSIITYGLKSNKKNRKTPLEILEKTVEYASESSLFAS